MVTAEPHFLLFCDTHLQDESVGNPGIDRSASSLGGISGKWHFVLERLDGSSATQSRFEAADAESSATQERLALLSVVRGLEALEQPSKVTLVTTSRYVSRGLRYGLSTWREADYKWERFGVQMPIRNADLWQRIDSALQYHGVTCRLIQSQSRVAAGLPLTAIESAEPLPATESAASKLSQEIGAESLVGSNARAKLRPRDCETNRRGKIPQTEANWDQIGSRVAIGWQRFWRGKARPMLLGG